MRLKINFTINTFTFSVYCMNARIDWDAGKIRCFVPDTFLDTNCCSFQSVFEHQMNAFDKIEAKITERTGIEYKIKFEKIEGEMEIVEGLPIFLYNEVKRQYLKSEVKKK